MIEFSPLLPAAPEWRDSVLYDHKALPAQGLSLTGAVVLRQPGPAQTGNIIMFSRSEITTLLLGLRHGRLLLLQ